MTNPEEETVAIPGDNEDHTPLGVVFDNCLVLPMQTLAVPVVAFTVGNGFTDTVVTEDSNELHPFASVTLTEKLPAFEIVIL